MNHPTGLQSAGSHAEERLGGCGLRSRLPNPAAQSWLFCNITALLLLEVTVIVLSCWSSRKNMEPVREDENKLKVVHFG